MIFEVRGSHVHYKTGNKLTSQMIQDIDNST